MGGRPGGGHWSFPSAASRLILVLKREPSREVGLRGGASVKPSGLGRWKVRFGESFFGFCLAVDEAEPSPSPPGIYSVARSGLRTLPDGEFDWGGTSVKR